mmetsp:Transcript_1883/g.3555  ORF Transcript_1883/g.3555 Transcript_1883/m.3555 type:complete len:126 (+) Transcript_1883:2-379(+)
MIHNRNMNITAMYELNAKTKTIESEEEDNEEDGCRICKSTVEGVTAADNTVGPLTLGSRQYETCAEVVEYGAAEVKRNTNACRELKMMSLRAAREEMRSRRRTRWILLTLKIHRTTTTNFPPKVL